MTLALTLLGGIVAAAIAAVLTHRFTSHRDQANRRSTMRTEYLLSAYRSLADAINRDLQGSPDDARAFEQGLEDIQLLGSREQVEEAVQLVQAMASDGEATPNELLNVLRDELREELDLEALPDPPVHLRIVPRAQKGDVSAKDQ